MINLIVNFLFQLLNFCILEEFTEILNIEKIVKEEEEVKEEHMDKGIQRKFLHILQELYIIIQYTQTSTFQL